MPADLNASPEAIVRECPRLGLDDRFIFQCGQHLDCFTQCCRDVNIMLTPYDVLRMKRALQIDSSEFLENHTLRLESSQRKFPVVILRMQDESKQCPFLSPQGCGIYLHRPWACRMYPLGRAEPKTPTPDDQLFHFLVREDLCHGHGQGEPVSVREWLASQQVDEYEMMSASFRDMTLHEFWDSDRKLTHQQSDMFYMACYDLDRFRRFVLETRFLQMFDVDEARVQALRSDDHELLEFGIQWVRFFIFGEHRMRLRPEATAGRKSA